MLGVGIFHTLEVNSITEENGPGNVPMFLYVRGCWSTHPSHQDLKYSAESLLQIHSHPYYDKGGEKLKLFSATIV